MTAHQFLRYVRSPEHRLNYHHLISQSTVSAAGPPLANAVVDA
jgi:hypothetical protein